VDWSLVRYMIGDIELGAQMTDDNDIRLLRTLSDMWLSDDLFSQSFAFTPSMDNPCAVTLKEHLDFFDSLPDCDVPETLGLMPKADTKYVIRAPQFSVSVPIGYVKSCVC